MSTFYTVLGLPETATDDEIKQTYRALAKKYHPDLHPGDAETAKKFAEVNEAMETLGDPAKRKAYDDKRAADKKRAEQGSTDAAAMARARAAAAARARAAAQAAASRPYMGTAAGAQQVIADARRQAYNDGFAAGRQAAESSRNATAETWKKSADNWKREAEKSHEEVEILKAALEKARTRATDAEASARRLELALKAQTNAAENAQLGADMEITAMRESYEERLSIEREARKLSEDDKVRLSREVLRLKEELAAFKAETAANNSASE